MTIPPVTAEPGRVAVTVPRDALVDAVCALAKEIAAGGPILAAFDYLASAGRELALSDDERDISYDAACNEQDQALTDLFEVLGDVKWRLTAEGANHLGWQLIHAAQDAGHRPAARTARDEEWRRTGCPADAQAGAL